MEYAVDGESLVRERKGVWQKALLACLVKKHCQVSNEWIAKRLEMGHPAGMSKVARLYIESEAGKQMVGKYEKILISKD